MPGGKGQDYWSSLDIDFERVKYHWLDDKGKEIPKKKADGEGPSYADLSFETKKNRACAPHMTGGFRIYFKDSVLPNGEEHWKGEIDELESLFVLGITHGLIRGGGKKWRFDDLRAPSQADLQAAIGADKEKYESLKEKLLGILLNGPGEDEDDKRASDT